MTKPSEEKGDAEPELEPKKDELKADDLEAEEPGADEHEAASAESGQPGLDALRAAVRTRLADALPGPPDPKRDGIAGLNVAIGNVPDGLANGVLVGVNPVYGLYATMIGPFVGGLFSSTRLMVVSTTAAASLTAGQAIAFASGEARESALFIMVVLAGLIQVALGLLGLGRLTRFVSYSVTTGFLTGVAVMLILSQLPTMAGIDAEGSNRVVQTYDLVLRVGEIGVWTPVLAALALTLAIVLPRTPLGNVGRFIAVVLPSALVVLLELDGVQTVRDVGEILGGIPVPDMPSIAAAFDVFTGAISLAIVILVHGTGVGQSVPNPDGSRSSISRDFIAQGAANIASGIFRGLPVGGSASTSALGVLSGARTRWASIFAGLWMAVIVIGIPRLVGYVAMPALGAMLILAGVGSIKPREIASVWQSGVAARLAGGATFLAMLFLPIQAAVGIGVVLSTLLFLRHSYTAIRLVEVVQRSDDRFEEREPPSTLQNRSVTVLDVYGDLFYAGARTLEERLPSARDVRQPVVVISLRGKTAAGATLVDVLARYADDLRRADGRLYLTGIRGESYHRLASAEKLRRAGAVHVYEATAIVGESTRRAVADGREWLARTGEPDA